MAERLEALESAVFALDEAIDALEMLGKHSECDVNCLTDMKDAYKREIDELNEELQREQEREQAALEREYWASR